MNLRMRKGDELFELRKERERGEQIYPSISVWLNILFIFEWIWFCRIWSFVSRTNPIWYFDASGAFIPKVKAQPIPLLYSIVSHDTENKNIIPVAEFLTTKHDSTNIAIYLLNL